MFPYNNMASAEVLYSAAGVGVCAVISNIVLLVLLRKRKNCVRPFSNNLEVFIWLVVFTALLAAIHSCLFTAVVFGATAVSTSSSRAETAMQYYCPVFQWASLFLRTLQFCFIVSALLEAILYNQKLKATLAVTSDKESRGATGMTKKFILHHCVLSSIAAAFFSLSFLDMPKQQHHSLSSQCKLLVFDDNSTFVSRPVILFLASFGVLLTIGICSFVIAVYQHLSATKLLKTENSVEKSNVDEQTCKQTAGSLPTSAHNMMISRNDDWDQLSNDSKRSRQQLIALGLTAAEQQTKQFDTVHGGERHHDDFTRNALRRRQLCLCVACIFVTLVVFDYGPYIAAVIWATLRSNVAEYLATVLPPALAALSSLLVSFVVFASHPSFRRATHNSCTHPLNDVTKSNSCEHDKTFSSDLSSSCSPAVSSTSAESSSNVYAQQNSDETHAIARNYNHVPTNNIRNLSSATNTTANSTWEQNNTEMLTVDDQLQQHVVRRPKRLPSNTNIILPLDTKVSGAGIGQQQFEVSQGLGQAAVTNAAPFQNNHQNSYGVQPHSNASNQQQQQQQKHNFYQLTGTSFDNSPLFNIDQRRVQLISNLIQAQEPPQLRYAVGKSSSHNAWKRFSMTSFNSLEGLLRSTNSRQSDRSYRSDAVQPPQNSGENHYYPTAQQQNADYSINNYRYPLNNYPSHYYHHQPQYKRHSSCFGAVPEEPIFVVAPLSNNKNENMQQISSCTTATTTAASSDDSLEPTPHDGTVGGVVLRRRIPADVEHNRQLKAAVKRRMKKFTTNGAMVGKGVEDPTKSWKYIPHARQEQYNTGEDGELHAHRQVNRNTKLNRNSNLDDNGNSQAPKRFSYHLPNNSAVTDETAQNEYVAAAVPSSVANEAPVWEEQQESTATDEGGRKLYFFNSTNSDVDEEKLKNELRQHQITSAQQRVRLQQFLYNGQLQNATAAAISSSSSYEQLHTQQQLSPRSVGIRTNGTFNWLAATASPYGGGSSQHSTRVVPGLPSRRAASFAATRVSPQNICKITGLNGGGARVCLERSPSSTHI